jgi:hypothetical protein
LLTARDAGRLIGVDYRLALRWLYALGRAGILELVQRGNQKRANRYRFLAGGAATSVTPHCSPVREVSTDEGGF